ncbi:MFS transporter [Porphyrobacter sp. AAP60]|uniref:MFS transporter n=1 Tax=Porphyrobacter sp. AAP60 TaxID=1523423 RepID=UPI000A5C63A8|nr:MFS transporter [Porphyrobacter sp. AAP60]
MHDADRGAAAAARPLVFPVAAPPLGRWTRLAFGLGAIAPGVAAGGFEFFLLIYYSQVVGLDARLVGLAILIALICDAISDPIVGYWSDNFRSRWGRRHPMMYASAIPVALSFFLLWSPPQEGASQSVLFWYLLVLAVTVRTALTFYRTPSSALTPELTADYGERTSLISLRYFLGWTGGNALSVWMFFILFPRSKTPEIADGRFNPEAYLTYGTVAAVVILLSILIGSIGVHSRIPYLTPAPPKRRVTFRLIFGELLETLSNRSFLALFAGAMLFGIAAGLSSGMSLYFFIYFWGFSEIETGMLFLGTFVAALIGFVLAPIASRRMGKKRGAIIVGLVAFLGAPLPIVLRLAGLLPPNDDPFVFWFVLVAQIIDVGLIICFQILFSAMLADLVEDSEVTTGRRSEGVFNAAETFVDKSVRGLGVMAASAVLTLAALPTGAKVEEVSADTLWWMGALYVPLVLALWLSMIAVIARYQIDEAKHAENLRQLGR